MTDDKLPAEAQGEAARRLPVDGGSLRPVEMGRRHGMFGGSPVDMRRRTSIAFSTGPGWPSVLGSASSR